MHIVPQRFNLDMNTGKSHLVFFDIGHFSPVDISFYQNALEQPGSADVYF